MNYNQRTTKKRLSKASQRAKRLAKIYIKRVTNDMKEIVDQ